MIPFHHSCDEKAKMYVLINRIHLPLLGVPDARCPDFCPLLIIFAILLHPIPYTIMSPVEIPHDLLGQSSLYNHSDPLLRRLRLDDSSGGSITDLDKAFKGKEVVVLYAGSEHGSSTFFLLLRQWRMRLIG
jgi:hypothetical protein